MNQTKKKIILTAIALFNKRGLVNISNQDISNSCNISLSNFNYYFGTKKSLVLSVFYFMKEVIESRVSESSLLTSEGHGLEICKIIFEFEQEFSFFYADTHSILQTYPELKEEMQKQIHQSIKLIKSINYISIGKGYLKPEPEEMPGLYDQLAEQMWLTGHFWFAQNEIRGRKEKSIIKGLQSCYLIFYPYLTPSGVEVNENFIQSLSKKKKKSSKTLVI